MTDSGNASITRVIVVAEPHVHELLSGIPAAWQVQERQPSVSAMWQALAEGGLDRRSRILVFSDSQHEGQTDDDAERRDVANAVVAMAAAGARVVLLERRPAGRGGMDAALDSAASAQGHPLSDLSVHRIDATRGDDALLADLRVALDGLVDLPAELGSQRTDAQTPRDRRPSVELSDLSALRGLESDDTSAGPATASIAAPAAATSTSRPSLPPIGSEETNTSAPSADEYPPQADRALLSLPRKPGQTTITVTSSKGGSGKSTVSILLAATIARASAEAGDPLSVCLLDLDTRDGQVASLIGKFMPTALNIRVQPVWDEERIRRNLVRAESLGIDTLLAPIRPRTADTVGPDFYRTIVRSLQRMYDVVIMDTSVQYLEPLIADVAFRESEEILFVTTLASTAIQGMARALREMTAPADESGLGVSRDRIGIIVNQSVANVGMERDQVLAAGLGVPVVGVIPLATRDVLTATNLNRMDALLEHPLLGPAYSDLARACLPGRQLATWVAPISDDEPAAAGESAPVEDAGRKRGLFRR